LVNESFLGLLEQSFHLKACPFFRNRFCGIEIANSVIDELIITGANPSNVRIYGCLIGRVDGVSEAAGLPKWLSGNEVGDYVRINTVTRIKQAKLSSEQKVFVTIIKKTFFQPGAGRKEEALLRGLDSMQSKKSSEKILKLLCREEILKTAPGKEGLLYIPQRAHTRRMADILKELTLSEDPLWKQLNPIN
jgi:hypothetical protein